MIVCIQRVKSASLTVSDKLISSIGKGYYILVGFEKGDSISCIDDLVKKVCKIKLFKDSKGRMGESIIDVGGEILIVSQFTLAADTSKGRVPNFGNAETPDNARILYDEFINQAKLILGSEKVSQGVFGESMEIVATNDGPVTIILNS